jgi:hypothetical protein
MYYGLIQFIYVKLYENYINKLMDFLDFLILFFFQNFSLNR